MNDHTFKDGIERLRKRFGEKNFDNEFCMVLWRDVRGLPDICWPRIIDFMVGSRPAHKPPLLPDFMEARVREEKLKFEREAEETSRSMRRDINNEGLRKHLAKAYGTGVKSLMEAIEIESLKMRIERANVSKEAKGHEQVRGHQDKRNEFEARSGGSPDTHRAADEGRDQGSQVSGAGGSGPTEPE